MVQSIFLALSLIPILSSVAPVFAQGGQVCNSTSLCPSEAPCCSEFGFCGDDQFCLGGCNPLASRSLDACRPVPVCQNTNYTFADSSRILSNATYFDGNASAHDWVVDKGNIMNTSSGELALLLTQKNGGTRLSSTRYVHYGTITARLKTGRWPGVVCAFITMSGIKDEIDWEFPGAQTLQGQTNYFWEGVVPAESHGSTEGIASDAFSNYHDYTIDWKPDALRFLVDGQEVRTINKADAIDGASGITQYPSSPSRIQLSLWPAGINSSAPGTVAWAGGMINWNDPDYIAAGHFYALVSSVSIQCADPQPPAPDIMSYIYGPGASNSTPAVLLSNHTTLVNDASLLLSQSGGWSLRGVLATTLISLLLLT